ncbi:MAG: c-type cytochrome biogenesis protein CcmI/CycH, partial [Thermoanaerobaculia bacterium]
HATKADPKNLDGWVALAWVYAQSDRMNEAEKMIAEAAKQSPNDKARLEDVFRQMKAQAAGAPAEPTPAQIASGELPAGHPPIDGAPAPAQAPAARPAAPADGKSVSVTLELDPAAAQKSGVLFVMARNPMGGPPVAVKRMQVASFPITFDFGSADSMMGQPLPDKFRLEARLDSDGDAATKPPTDPSAIQNDVAPGTTVKLALK